MVGVIIHAVPKNYFIKGAFVGAEGVGMSRPGP